VSFRTPFGKWVPKTKGEKIRKRKEGRAEREGGRRGSSLEGIDAPEYFSIKYLIDYFFCYYSS